MIFCQSCGMPMTAPEHFGTEADGTPNNDYCAYCYKEGVFTQECSMEEMIQHCAQFHEEFRHEDLGAPTPARRPLPGMREFFPHLKRVEKIV